MSSILNIAKVTSKGQITLPSDVRSMLGVRTGDKIIFINDGQGNVILRNSNLEALERAQEKFARAAEEADLKDEDDLQELIKSVRAERASQVHKKAQHS